MQVFFMEQNATEFCREVAISNDYEDFIIEFSSDVDFVMEQFKPVCFFPTGPRFGVFYQRRDPENEKKYLNLYEYNMIPDLFGLLDTTSLEAIGVLKVRRQPYLDLYGRDVMIGFIDTGIDYQNPVFQNADGTTRILSIWDQADQTGPLPPTHNFGSEYTQERINQALRSENPAEIVPTTDEIGHGTFMAGVAAGGIDAKNDFSGVAPNADIVVVKLKQSKPYLKSLYGIAQDKIAYASTDILLGINYVWSVARRVRKPVVICLGVGSNSGDHTGRAILSSFLDEYADLVGNCVVVAAGNEGNQAHHFRGELTSQNESIPMEIRVGANEPGLTIEMWGTLPYLFSLSITSPTGEVIPRVASKTQPSGTYNLTFEKTQIDIRYEIRESRSGDQLVLIRLKNPTEGIWTITIYSDTNGKQFVDAWLPMQQFISKDTYFIRPDPDITITQPGNSENTITVATYNHYTGSIYIESSRGPMRNGRQEPTITAPGVDVYGPIGRNQFGTRTGSSVAAALTGGVSALLFEWGIVQKNNMRMSTTNVKQMLVSGANRTEGVEYPNNIWGYGTVDLYESFNSIRLTTS